MGQEIHTFANRLASKASNQPNRLQTQGNKIMMVAEILRPMIAKWLEGARTRDGLPVQPATVRAVALNTAQNLLKQHV
jgi:hypothetical protein